MLLVSRFICSRIWRLTYWIRTVSPRKLICTNTEFQVVGSNFFSLTEKNKIVIKTSSLNGVQRQLGARCCRTWLFTSFKQVQDVLARLLPPKLMPQLETRLVRCSSAAAHNGVRCTTTSQPMHLKRYILFLSSLHPVQEALSSAHYETRIQSNVLVA